MQKVVVFDSTKKYISDIRKGDNLMDWIGTTADSDSKETGGPCWYSGKHLSWRSEIPIGPS